jgi:hypothetical protein
MSSDCPTSFWPQQSAAPLDVIAQVWSTPAQIVS